MLNQILNAGLKILFFRGGPQDFPYAPGLTLPVALGAVVVNAGVFSVTMPAPLAVAAAVAMVGGAALVTRSVLRARNFPNRYDQTFNALLFTTSVLMLLTLPALLQLAPLFKLMAQNPELRQKPEAMRIPQGAAMMIDLLTLWSIAVSAHIFRHAADTRLWVGVIIALIGGITAIFLAVFAILLTGAVLAIGGA